MAVMVRRLNDPIQAVWITLAAYGVFILLKLALAGFNPTVFINAGDRFARENVLGSGFAIQSGSNGYDGQFFYRLAITPVTRQADSHGIILDNPSYRHQRIAYPLIARIMAFRQNNLVPWGLIAANLAGLAALAWLGAVLAAQFGRHALWGLAIPFFPGFLMSLSFDLAEIVQAAFILAGILAVVKNRYIPAAVMLTLAVMTRESALIVPGAGLLIALYDYRNSKKIRPVIAFATPLTAFFVWQVLLYLNWGRMPVFSATNPLTAPLLGFFGGLGAMVSMPLKSMVLYLMELGFLLLFSLSVALVYRKNPAPGLVRLSCLFYGVLLSVLSSAVWEYGMGFLRVSTEFFILGTLIVLASNRRRLISMVVTGQAVLWLALFVKLSILDA